MSDDWGPTVVNPEGTWRGILVCDHASNFIPPEYENLGLGPEVLSTHIASDIGARELTLELSDRLNAPAVLSPVSRLVVDCNRSSNENGLILEESDGVPIPGNVSLRPDLAKDRFKRWHMPYHTCIAKTLRQQRRRNAWVCFVSIHSFTPVLMSEDGTEEERPWHLGILWNRNERLVRPVLRRLKESGDWNIGLNQPYSGRTNAHTVNLHAQAIDIPHCSFEMRQDELGTPENITGWAERLASALDPSVTEIFGEASEG